MAEHQPNSDAQHVIPEEHKSGVLISGVLISCVLTSVQPKCLTPGQTKAVQGSTGQTRADQ